MGVSPFDLVTSFFENDWMWREEKNFLMLYDPYRYPFIYDKKHSKSSHLF